MRSCRNYCLHLRRYHWGLKRRQDLLKAASWGDGWSRSCLEAILWSATLLGHSLETRSSGCHATRVPVHVGNGQVFAFHMWFDSIEVKYWGLEREIDTRVVLMIAEWSLCVPPCTRSLSQFTVASLTSHTPIVMIASPSSSLSPISALKKLRPKQYNIHVH